MYINSISALTNLVDGSRVTVGKNTSSTEGQSKFPATVNTTELGFPASQVLASFANTSYIKAQLETIMNSFPPYFPAGSPQRIDLIKGIRGVQDEIGKSSLSPVVKAKLTAQKLSDNATDKEVAVALKDLQHYTKAQLPRKMFPQLVKVSV